MFGGFGLGFRGGTCRLRSLFVPAGGELGLAGGAALTFSLASISLGSTSSGSLVMPEPGDDTGGAYHADFGTKTGFFGCDSKCGDIIWAPYSLNASWICAYKSERTSARFLPSSRCPNKSYFT